MECSIGARLSGMSNCFTGKDRLEVRAMFGRPVRLGGGLAESDGARVAALLRAGDLAGATERVQGLVPHYEYIITTYLEWALAAHSLIAERHGGALERRLAAETHQTWRGGLTPGHGFGEEAVACVAELLQPAATMPGGERSFRTAEGPRGSAAARALNAAPDAARDRALAALAAQDADGALAAFVEWQSSARHRHDLIGRHVAILATHLAHAVGQSAATDTMQQGLESCAALGGMWAFTAAAGPEDLALMLAEHLRAHFSGAARDGQVDVVDEPDRIRLVFAPCGSGGAMRRAGFDGHAPLPAATPETWHRANEVPAYCAHCAKNELTSLDRLGRLAWVTEFDPDPAKPCGWTVFKDPARVPDAYYTRLGRKPPAR